MKTALAVALALASSAVAQVVPEGPPPTARDGDPARPALEAAERALEAGRNDEARRHLANALWHRPSDPELLVRALEACGDDVDLRTSWAHVLFAAAADDRGKVRAPREWRDLLPADAPYLERLPASRAAAIAELAAFARKSGRSRSIGAPLLPRFARLLAWDLARAAPGTWAKHGRALNDACAPRRDAHAPVVQALKRLAQDALGAGDTKTAIEAARALRGLARQTGLKDLKGPEPPDLEVIEEQAADLLGRARERLGIERGAPLTIDALEEMTLEERLAFTRAHGSFGDPGIALSENGRYRIETNCGWETLVGAAKTIELHHARLVDLFGRDPFEGRRGTVRIVPEAEGLEAEGVPYWWAGGFQSGDLTVVRFNASSIPALGRGLTHELTHRFDGAVFPGLPAWLTEGKAVWTAGSYDAMRDATFIENDADTGAMDQTMRKGYGGKEKLTELIEGTIEDYRDNYVAGYALFVYLNSWEENGRRLFRDRLSLYQEQCASKGRRNPIAWFTSCFADGAAGRPKGFDAFAKAFDAFVRGFFWLDPKPWAKSRYNTVPRKGEPPWRVLDAPTWQFSRNRAEPWFGQGQAARAGELLLAYGWSREAATALVWAFEIDEWSTVRALALADLLESVGEKQPAWVLRSETRRRVPRDDVPEAGPSPLLSVWPRVRAHLDLLAEAADHHAAAGRPLTAARLAADHALLARRLGLDPKSSAPCPPPTDRAAPFEPAARNVAWLGLTEDGFTGYEEHRVEELWYADAEGGIHVGRKKPRDDTGQLDRAAHYRHAFVRTTDWIPPGRWRVTARVQFTTTFVDGCVAVGWTRRDRNVRFEFSGGDYMYSIGQKENAAELDSVWGSLHAVRDGESPGAGQTVGEKIEFEHPSTSFLLELLVDGPLVVAYVNGRLIGSYHSADGQPVEGTIGFGSSFGAYRVERPTIETLDRQRALGAIEPRTRGLTLEREGETLAEGLANRPVRGVPLSPRGTVVAWVPGPTDEEIEEIGDEESVAFERRRRMYIAFRTAQSATDLLWKGGYEARCVLAIPSFVGDHPDERAELERQLADAEIDVSIVVHDKVTDLRKHGDEAARTEMPVLVFVDPVGVLRHVMQFAPHTSHLPGNFDYWLSIHRGRAESDGS